MLSWFIVAAVLIIAGLILLVVNLHFDEAIILFVGVLLVFLAVVSLLIGLYLDFQNSLNEIDLKVTELIENRDEQKIIELEEKKDIIFDKAVIEFETNDVMIMGEVE